VLNALLQNQSVAVVLDDRGLGMGVAFAALAVSLTIDFPIAICAAVATAAIVIATPRLGRRQFDNMRWGPPILHFGDLGVCPATERQ
jgi:hypothetical protein